MGCQSHARMFRALNTDINLTSQIFYKIQFELLCVDLDQLAVESTTRPPRLAPGDGPLRLDEEAAPTEVGERRVAHRWKNVLV